MAEAKNKDGKPVAPAITGHGAMISELTTSTETPAATPKAASTSKLKIEPLNKLDDIKPAVTERVVENDDADDGADGSEISRDKLKDATGDKQEILDKKAAERAANLDKIVEAKTYFLPINQIVRRRSKQFAVAGSALALLLGLAWADVALDAGLITVPGVKAPTHFFGK